MHSQRLEFVVAEGGVRLDKLLPAEVPGLSRSAAQSLIASGRVQVNGQAVKASHKARPGDRVTVDLPAPEAAVPVAQAIPLNVVYEDDYLVVVDKPAGMVVHPAPGHTEGTLVNAVLARYPELASSGDDRPGIVHRLDRDTSGLIVVARSDKVRRALQRQFQQHTVQKVYLALLHGALQPNWGRIEAPLGRDPHHRQRVAVLPGGREAVTEYHVVEVFRAPGTSGDLTLVTAEPKTGRTHQIRVHFASIGHPVVGDRTYGHRRAPLQPARQFLHAWRLGFEHPVTGRRLELEAPLPADLASVLESLRRG